MAKWISDTALDAALNAVKNGVTAEYLTSAYAQADSYATVNGNKIGSATGMTSGSFTGPTASGQNRVLTVSQQTGTASATLAAGGGNLHVVLVDVGGTKVWAATDETTEQAITSGNPITFPSWTITLNNLT
jgi:hypothetical protein